MKKLLCFCICMLGLVQQATISMESMEVETTDTSKAMFFDFLIKYYNHHEIEIILDCLSKKYEKRNDQSLNDLFFKALINEHEYITKALYPFTDKPLILKTALGDTVKKLARTKDGFLLFYADSRRLMAQDWDYIDLTPTLIAVLLNNAQLVKFCLKRDPKSIHDKDRLLNRNCFMLAAMQGNAEILKFMLKFQPDFRHKDNIGRTALSHLAEQSKRTEIDNVLFIEGISPALQEIIFAILDAGIDVNTPLTVISHDTNFVKNSLLFLVLTGSGDPLFIKGLLKRGAQLPPEALAGLITCFYHRLSKTEIENMPVHWGKEFCLENMYKILLLMLEYGADINGADQDTLLTPLMVACKFGAYDVAKLLLEKGADATCADNSHKTALAYAQENGDSELITLVAQQTGSQERLTKQHTQKMCAHCSGKPGQFRCSKCKKVHYCSANCQRKHWPIHKKSCI